MSNIESRLKELGITLPAPPAPVASYVPFVISGNLVFISGQVPLTADGPQICRQAGRGYLAGRRQGRGAALRRQSPGAAESGLRRRSRPGAALREAGRLRQRHARFHPASGSGQWRLRPDRGGVRRCRQAQPAPPSAPARCRAAWRWKWMLCSRSHDTSGLRTALPASGPGRWNACANPDGRADPHPFTRFEFFEALEASGSATAAHRLAAGPSGAGGRRRGHRHHAAYLKSHSQGEYVFDHAWADALERAGGDYYPKLQCAVPFTPVTGRRILTRRRRSARPAAQGRQGGDGADRRFLAAHHLSDKGGMGGGRREAYLLRTDQQFHWRESRL